MSAADPSPLRLDKLQIARVLREIAALLQLKGESQFKTRAYETAADSLMASKESLAALVAEERLDELAGFGKAISAKVYALATAGELDYHQKLLAEFPRPLIDLMAIDHLGPRKAAILYRELKIADPASLEKACLEGRVRTLKGFGPKSELAILGGLAALKRRSGSIPLSRARPIAEAVREHVARAPGVVRTEIAGSARRFCETVGDVDLLASIAAGADPAVVMDYLTDFPGVSEVVSSGDTKTTVIVDERVQVDLRVLPDEDFATALHHFTGSKAHHVKLRGIARDHHLTLSEWGLFRLQPDGTQGEKLPIPREEDIYAALSMDPIPPEMREDRGEIEAAQAHRVPQLVEQADLKGVTHAHTLYSDGKSSIAEMARAALAMGMKYLTITDHSRTAGYAGGLDEERLRRQWEEIDQVNEEVPEIRLLKGSEVDILEDGTLDFPDALLARLDVVIGSIHQRYKMDAEQMTQRVSRAFDNPHLHIWGHATGRLIGEREPYGLKMEELLDKAARKGVAVEINGAPDRLDLSSDHARMAVERGVELVLSVDAHSTLALGNLRFAVGTARRAWVTRENVLTRLDADAFVDHLKHMRS